MNVPSKYVKGTALACMLGLALGTWAPRADAVIPDDEAAQYQLVINAKLDKVVNDLVDHEAIASQLFLPFPVQPPTAEREELETRVAEKISSMADVEYKDQTEEYYAKLAREKYRIYDLYDEVSVLKANDEIVPRGKLREIEPTYIVIGPHKVYRHQLAAESKVHFDPALSEQKIATFVRLKMAEMREDRKRFEEAQRTDVEREIYTEAGYIQIQGSWETQQEFFQQVVAKQKQALRERFLGLVVSNVYYDFGYVLHNGEWMKPEERQRMIEEAEANGGGAATTSGGGTTTAPAAPEGDADGFFDNNG